VNSPRSIYYAFSNLNTYLEVVLLQEMLDFPSDVNHPYRKIKNNKDIKLKKEKLFSLKDMTYKQLYVDNIIHIIEHIRIDFIFILDLIFHS
jgi:hypothetical protein